MVSTNTEIIVSIITLFISVIIIGLYYKKKISIVEAIIYCYSSETWVVNSVGPTINPTFFLKFYNLYRCNNPFFFKKNSNKQISFYFNFFAINSERFRFFLV